VTEIDTLISGAVGGSVAAFAVTSVVLGQIRHAYDKKLQALQMQLIALRAELNAGYESD
jgi:hypothetical protein